MTPEGWDTNAEIDRLTQGFAQNMVDMLDLPDHKAFDYIARQATEANLSRVIQLAGHIGVQQSIIDDISLKSPPIQLPSEDVLQPRRLDILPVYGGGGTVRSAVIKPNSMFMKQVFLTTQATYDDIFGLWEEEDRLNVRRETIAFAHRYGLGLLLYKGLEAMATSDDKIFVASQHNLGENAFAGFFATYLSQPQPDTVYDDADHRVYCRKFRSWGDTIKRVIENKNPNRRAEVNDAFSFGIINPMSLEDVEKVVLRAGEISKEKRHLSVVT